jgi:acetyltransferase-like isoleucine patch superfamily enzyme
MELMIHPNVVLGEGADMGLYVILGQPPRGRKPGELQTLIGAGAVIRSHTIIYAGNRIGKNFQTGHHVMIREENEIGDDVSVGTGAVVEHHVRIGDGARIHSQAFVPEYCVLEPGCWIGPNAVLTNAKYPNRPDTKENLRGVTVGRGAVVGANATILPGVRIGERALIGAGAVVTRDVPAGAVVYGAAAIIRTAEASA